MKSSKPLEPIEVTLFTGAPIRQPIAPFPTYPFYSVSPFLREIESVAKGAQRMLKNKLKD